MKKTFRARDIWPLLRDSGLAWDNDNAWRLGAALSYFTIFSLAPLLVIVTVISSFGFGEEAARGNLVSQIRGLIGTDGAKLVENMITNAYHSGAGWMATVFGIVTLVLGASGVIVELRSALYTLWRIQEKPIGTILGFLRARFFSLAMIVGLGFLFLVSLVLSAALAAFGSYLADSTAFLGGLVDFLVSFTGIGLVFALIFKFLCNVVVPWKDVLVGGAVTSLLFFLGKFAIGFYLGTAAVGSTFGATSSLVIIILWTFYSSQIVLYGAEFTRLYAERFGKGIYPGANAIGMKAPQADGSQAPTRARSREHTPVVELRTGRFFELKT